MRLSLASIPTRIQEVLGKFHEKGFEAWVVGGALRDLLWGWEPKDWDLATNATSQEVMGLFPRVIPIGIRHGTVRILWHDQDIEVTSCPVQDREWLVKDLGRRDFTVNAMALSYPQGRLIDPFHGAEDLRRRILRGVGDPRARLREDPLRTLRAGRLVSVYGFEMEPPTADAIGQEAPGLAGVATERIREEFFKLLLGSHFLKAFQMMRRGGVMGHILPELEESDGQGTPLPRGPLRLERALLAVHHGPPNISVRLAALFHNIGMMRREASESPSAAPRGMFEQSAETARLILRRLRVSRNLEEKVVALISNQIPDRTDTWTDGDLRRFLAGIEVGLVDDLLALAQATRSAEIDGSEALAVVERLGSRLQEQLAGRPPLRVNDLAIDGGDVMESLHLEPGPQVGKILKALHELVLEDPSRNSRKFLMDFLRKEYHIGFVRSSVKEDQMTTREE
jgi:tRNA nucleotidyltransferase (CCA-adding enzyme)